MRFFPFLFGCLFLLPAYGEHFRFTGNAGFEIDQVKGELYVLDGKAKRELPLALRKEGETLVLESGECRLTLDRIEQRARLWHFQGGARNLGKQDAFWEIGIRLFPTLLPDDQFWGGVDPLPIEGKPIVRAGKGAGSYKRDNRPWLAFPVAAVFGGNRAVIAAGRNGVPLSYTSASLFPRGEQGTLAYAIRIVPGPGRTLDFSLSAGVVPMRFENEENVVQAHYDAFPEDWRALQGWDNQYIWGADSYYAAWKANPPSREKLRRRYATIEWAYTPWKRPGDVFGTEKYWHYEPSAPFQSNFSTIYNGEFFDYTKLTVPEFHAKRKRLFDLYARDFGYCFYTCPAWCEKNLAKEHFPDSLNLDVEESLPRELGRWTTLNHRELAVMPQWSDYGKFFTESIQKAYAELRPVGIAMDGGGCGVYYRGEATKNADIPERAWDEKGIFMDESAAVDRLVDVIHALNPENPPIAWKNSLGKSDYMMLETSIFNPYFKRWMPHMRYLMGQRPVSVHSPGYLFDDTIPAWRNMTHEQFMTAFGKLADHVVFTDFEYGFTECYSTRDGNPRSIYVQPELLECMRLGWQALSPVETDNQGKYLYRSRFGRGADTILFFGNPWEEPMPLHFKVDNTYLGGVNLFVRKMRDQASLSQRYRAPDTCFQDTLPSRLPALYEAIVSLSDAPDGLGAEATARKDLNRQEYTLKLDNASPFRASITPRRIRNYIAAVKVNGREPDGTIPPQAVITVEYRSTLFGCTFAELNAFPWLDSRTILPDNPNQAEQKAARYLDEYFEFLGLKRKEGAAVVWISVGLGADRGEAICMKNGELLFHATTPLEARGLMLELNAAMDRKFPYFVKEPYGGPVMKRKFDFLNHPLTYRRCFEKEEVQ